MFVPANTAVWVSLSLIACDQDNYLRTVIVNIQEEQRPLSPSGLFSITQLYRTPNTSAIVSELIQLDHQTTTPALLLNFKPANARTPPKLVFLQNWVHIKEGLCMYFCVWANLCSVGSIPHYAKLPTGSNYLFSANLKPLFYKGFPRSGVIGGSCIP